jgi:hypothetical protein
MVNGADDVYVERKGPIERGGKRRQEERGWACASRLGSPMTEAARAPDTYSSPARKHLPSGP